MSFCSYFSSEHFNRDQILSILKHPGSQITSNIKKQSQMIEKYRYFLIKLERRFSASSSLKVWLVNSNCYSSVVVLCELSGLCMRAMCSRASGSTPSYRTASNYSHFAAGVAPTASEASFLL